MFVIASLILFTYFFLFFIFFSLVPPAGAITSTTKAATDTYAAAATKVTEAKIATYDAANAKIVQAKAVTADAVATATPYVAHALDVSKPYVQKAVEISTPLVVKASPYVTPSVQYVKKSLEENKMVAPYLEVALSKATAVMDTAQKFYSTVPVTPVVATPVIPAAKKIHMGKKSGASASVATVSSSAE